MLNRTETLRNAEASDAVGDDNLGCSASQVCTQRNEFLTQVQDDVRGPKFFLPLTLHISPLPAFTISEVIVTLGIIGVIAAMAIPNLFSNYQKTQYVAKLKKTYATASQALNQLAVDAGCPNDLVCTGLLANDLVTFGDEYVKYFNVIKNCRNQAGCWPRNFNFNYDGSGTSYNYDSTVAIGRYLFITADGVGVSLYRYSNCASNFSTNVSGDLTNVCAGIDFDVNGNSKDPNFDGRDMFGFFITQGKGLKLYPYGGVDSKGDTWNEMKYWNGTTKTCYSGNKLGYSCIARVMEEGWEMNY